MSDVGVSAFAKATPDKPAIIDGDRVVTFEQLDRRINQLARALRARGVGAGDRIGSALRNSVEWFEVAGAASRTGVVVVPVSWRNLHDEVAYLVEDSGAKAVFAEADATEVMDGLPAIFVGDDYEALLGSHDDGPLDEVAEPSLAGFRFYTSGTTGRPKAIEREAPTGAAAAAWRAAIGAAVPEVALGPDGKRPLGRGQTEGLEASDEVHLLVGPAYHTAPGAFANRAVQQYGQTVAIMRHFDAEECLRLIERHRVSYTHMVPINFVRLLALPPSTRGAYDLSSIRRVLHAAAPCPVGVKREIMELFPPGSVYEYYGATEGLATLCPADEWLAKPGTVGRAAPGVEVRVLDDDGRVLPPGEVGSVYFTPPMHFSYAGAPEKTEQAWRGDLFTAGDMGYLDADGYLFLTDRKIDMIISGGANVYPAEVESVLFTHPAVADVVVFGLPDKEFGERVHAVVERRGEVSEEQIVTFCRDRIAHYKCPSSVEFVDGMPRDPNGKVRKRLLRDKYWAGTERKI
ncbi:MAG TPA: AMP-binding protein [Acidimicrobiales bacterium]